MMKREFSVSGVKTLAHISDLHIGRWFRGFKSTVSLYESLKKLGVDLVIVTGDITENGRLAEYKIFKEIFSDFIDQGRLIMVPGNHDRLGEVIADNMMNKKKIDIFRAEGLFLIRVDTTGNHNNRWFKSHGQLDRTMLDQLCEAVAGAQPSDFVVLTFHHHPLPLPEDLILEKIASIFGWPYAAELTIGKELINRMQGTCDLILHGHRHRAWEKVVPDLLRPLRIYNAGASNILHGFRVFKIKAGKLLESPEWIDFGRSC